MISQNNGRAIGRCSERNYIDDSVRDQTNGLREVLTPEDLAEFLGISVWTVYAKTSRRNRNNTNVDLPPFFRMGKLVRFWRKDLLCWLETRKKVDPNKP